MTIMTDFFPFKEIENQNSMRDFLKQFFIIKMLDVLSNHVTPNDF